MITFRDAAKIYGMTAAIGAAIWYLGPDPIVLGLLGFLIFACIIVTGMAIADHFGL